MTNKQRKFRVLSIDGGGFRGLYTATLLNTLSKRFNSEAENHDIGKAFDLIVGTSTGGILASGLAAGIPIQNIIDIYVQKGPAIFSAPQPNGWKFLLWGANHIGKPSCKAESLKESFSNIFKSETIAQVYKRRNIAICIPAVDAETHSPWVFKTPHIKGKERDNNYSLVDVCLSTSAAPIYFPIHACESPDNKAGIQNFVDGGLWANNPILIGVVEALKLAEKNQEIEIVSIGTLPAPSGSVIQKTKRGLWGWKGGAEALLMSMDAQASGFDYISGFLTGSLNRKCSIYRIDKNKACPSSDQAKYLAMDNAGKNNIKVLIKLAETAANRIHGEEMAKLDKGEESVVADIFKNFEPLPTFSEGE